MRAVFRSRPVLLLCVALASWLWIELAERPPRMLSVPEAQRHRTQPDRTDEPEWAAISIAHVRQLFLGEAPPGVGPDPVANPWRRGVHASTFGATNPCLAKLLWGTTAVFAGHPNMPVDVFQRFHKGDAVAAARARAVVEKVMPGMRRWVVLWTVVAAVLLFACARAMGGVLAGLFAWAAWCSSPLVQTWSHYIRPDLLMVALSLATLAAALAWSNAIAGRRGAARQLASLVGLGALAGLCISTKLNGAVSCLFVGLSVPLVAVLQRDRSVPLPVASLVLGSIASVVVCAGLFYLLNPVLWSDPWGEGQKILAFWERHMEFQRERWEGMGGRGAPDLSSRVGLVWERGFLRDEPLCATFGIPGGWVAALFGLAVLSLRSYRGDPAVRARCVVVLVWVGVTVVATTVWLPLDWDRYYFVFVACMALAEAAVIAWLVGWRRQIPANA